jgi:hypothetical protein
MPTADDPPHDFADQAIREQLQNPANLRELLHEVLGELADGFVCDERQLLPRDFPLEDWRHRESDLLFRIPYRTPAETVPVFVCVLLEHQSRQDPLMPLRTLLYAVLYWEREWKVWEALPAPRPSLRLTPVVPIVFHTGKARWRKHRELAELLGGPEPFRQYAPSWRPMFLDLAGKAPAELLQATGEWLSALALVRDDDAEAEAFRAVLEQVLRRLEGLADRDPVRWHELVRFSLVWALYRRPPPEREPLIAAAQASQMNVARQKEVQAVGMTIADALKAEGKAEGMAEGKAEGMAEGKAEGMAEGKAKGMAEGKAEGRLDDAREMLQGLLEEKFGSVPDAVRQRIQAATDLARLHAAARAVLHLDRLEEFDL